MSCSCLRASKSWLSTSFSSAAQNLTTPIVLQGTDCIAVLLQILTLLGALAVTGMGMIHHGRVAVVGMLAIVTVFISDSCDTFYYCEPPSLL